MSKPLCQLYCGEKPMAAPCCVGSRGGGGGGGVGGGASSAAAPSGGGAHLVCAPCLLQWLRANAKPSCPVCAKPLAAAGLDEVVRSSRRGKARPGALRPVGADEEARWRAGGRAAPADAAAAKADPRTARRLRREFLGDAKGTKP